MHQVKYSEGELQLWHDLIGMPLANNYEELMSMLENESEDRKQEGFAKVRKESQGRKRG